MLERACFGGGPDDQAAAAEADGECCTQGLLSQSEALEWAIEVCL